MVLFIVVSVAVVAVVVAITIKSLMLLSSAVNKQSFQQSCDVATQQQQQLEDNFAQYGTTATATATVTAIETATAATTMTGT